uniref:Uncharacterized protein n=1 Tax=Heliothis virescens TaxID=7102 RepID=A0A2A4J8D6_HELVI
MASEDACTPLAEEAPLSGGGASAGAGEPRAERACACAAWAPRRQPAPHEILRPKPRRSRLGYKIEGNRMFCSRIVEYTK